MAVSGIVDGKSLEAWLNSLPQGTEAEKAEAQRWAGLIAHRAAMRVLPALWSGFVSRPQSCSQVSILRFLRCSVLSGVAGTDPDPQIGAMATVAADAASTTDTATVDLATESAAEAVVFAAFSADRTRAPVANSAKAVGFAGHWAPLRQDCIALVTGQDPNLRPLWPSDAPIARQWDDLRATVLAQGDGWQFWVTWYDKVLRGDPQDWGLLTKVALIDPEDWEKGADHVNALIAEIRLKHLAETRPLGEEAIDKGADGLWHRTGHSDIDRDTLQDARDSVLDVMDRVRDRLRLTNSLSALAPEIDLLDRALTRYPNRPLRLHDTFLHVQRHVARDLDSGELPDDHIVHDLSQTLGTAALDLCNACARTREVIEARARARFAEADDNTRFTLAQITMAAAQISDAELASEFIEDAQIVSGSARPDEDRGAYHYRLTTRLAKIVTQDGGNILAALKEIGAIGGGVTTFLALTYFVLSLIL